jgi:hypothetical protein
MLLKELLNKEQLLNFYIAKQSADPANVFLEG